MTLHADSIIIDGLIISNFGRDVFEDMRRGGLTAANCTCCVWENFTQTMRNVMRWKTWFREHGDLITQVYGTTLKAIIHEMFGDGIMSAIDFTLDVQKQADPKGDRVVVTMNGKFLPYKKW